MLQVTEKTIKNGCGSMAAYQKGMNYFQSKLVCKLEFNEKEQAFQAEVKGTHLYEITIGFSTDGDVYYADCDCPAYATYGGYCKHIVAVLLEIRDWIEENTYSDSTNIHVKASGNNQKANLPRPATIQKDEERERAKKVVKTMLDYVYRHQELPVEKSQVMLEPMLAAKWNNWQKTATLSLSLKIGTDRLYVVKNMEAFLEAIIKNKAVIFGKKFTFNPQVHEFAPKDQQILNVLKELYEINKLITSRYGYYDTREKVLNGKEAILISAIAEKALRNLRGRRFSAWIMDKEYNEVTIQAEDLPLNFSLAKQGKDMLLKANFNGNIISLVNEGGIYFYNGKIYLVTKEQQQNLVPIFFAIGQMGKNIVLPEEYQEQIVSELFPCFKKAGQIQMDESITEALYQAPLQAEVYLDGEDQQIRVELKFKYGEYTFNPLAGSQDKKAGTNGRIIVRDREKEQKVLSYFEKDNFKVRGPQMHLDEEENIFEFVYQTLPLLQKDIDVYYSDKFKRIQVRPGGFKGKIGINSDTDLLEIGFEMEGINRNELNKIFDSLKEKRKFYRLKDGSFLPLDDSNLLEIAEVLEGMELRKSGLNQKIISIPKYRAVQLDHAFQEGKLNLFRRDRAFKELVQNIKEPGDMDFEVPSNLEEVLRDYQKVGFKWLKTLATYGFGGILADDMGLGKTLQAIAFIYSEREKAQNPALVVCPTSVVYNWQAEIARFTPDLKVKVISGAAVERKQSFTDLAETDVVITSYALLRRDIAYYKDKHFSCFLLDEAQYIKNPNSLTAKAAKNITAKNILAMTGTPMENSLAELWSIFDCVMPGYLYSYKKFTDKYSKAVEQEGEVKTSAELSHRISPFILRRLKKDVLAELPEKTERKMVSELTDEQKKLYLTYLDRLRMEMATEITQNGFDKSRLKILAGLTRLRQICCHPALFLEDYRGKSGKLMQLQELVQDAVAGGHRILVFSQFTGMLQMIGKMLEKEKLNYFYLDGAVPAVKRLEMANAFNEGERKLFLISLKAGGTGLNLTGADMVIHFDLWWNPAVENQASDRAHRLGQTKNVQVMKLVSMGTIEEKIFELQQKKKELIDRVIKPGESMLTALSEEDIKGLLEI